MLTANCPLPAGWWLVESEDKRLAWFPAPYLELCDEEEEEEGGFLGGESLFTWTGLRPEPPADVDRWSACCLQGPCTAP